MSAEAVHAFVLPLALGLIGFVEPCSLGATYAFLKIMEGRPSSVKAAQVAVFTVTRAAVMGMLGIAAVLAGSAFLGFQKAVWLFFGFAYAVLGALYATRRTDFLMVSVGPRIAWLSGLKASGLAGAVFALNVPACAAPLLLGLLGGAAAGSAGGSTLAAGFGSLALFGLALSAPLVAAVLIPRADRVLDWLAGWGRNAPVWTGLVLLALGAWSAWFGLYVSTGESQ